MSPIYSCVGQDANISSIYWITYKGYISPIYIFNIKCLCPQYMHVLSRMTIHIFKIFHNIYKSYICPQYIHVLARMTSHCLPVSAITSLSPSQPDRQIFEVRQKYKTFSFNYSLTLHCLFFPFSLTNRYLKISHCLIQAIYIIPNISLLTTFA